MPAATGSIAFLGAARFQGFWNASAANMASGSGLDTAYDHVASGGLIYGLFATGSSSNAGYNSHFGGVTAKAGDYWQVTGAGNFNVDGETNWRVNDWCIFSGSHAGGGSWRRLAYEDTIASIVIGDLTSGSFHMGAENNRHIVFASGSSALSGSDNLEFNYDTNQLHLTGTMVLSGSTAQYLMELYNATNSGEFIKCVDGNEHTSLALRSGNNGYGLVYVHDAAGAVALTLDGSTGGVSFGGTSAIGETIAGDGTDLTIASGGDIKLTATSNVEIPDDVKLTFGDSNESYIQYTETSDNYLTISGSALGIALSGSTVAIDGNLRIKGPGSLGGGPAPGIVFETENGSSRGFIAASEDSPHLDIATSGGESIAFRDAGLAGTINMLIAGDGDVGIGSDSPEHRLSITGTLGVSGDTTVSGTIYSNHLTASTISSSFYGDGAHLSNVPSVANGANDRIATFSSADALNGEANLTFSSANLLTVAGNITASTNVSASAFYGQELHATNIDLSANLSDILIKDHTTAALQFKEGSNDYLTFSTLNTLERVILDKNLQVKDDIKLLVGGSSVLHEAEIFYNEAGDDFMVISGSAKGVAISGSTIDVDGRVAIGRQSTGATGLPEHTLSVTGTLGVSGDTSVSGNIYAGTVKSTVGNDLVLQSEQEVNIVANSNIILDLDEDNNSTSNSFMIRNGANTPIFYVLEASGVSYTPQLGVASGDPEHTLSVTGTLGVSGDTTVSGTLHTVNITGSQFYGGNIYNKNATTTFIDFESVNNQIILKANDLNMAILNGNNPKQIKFNADADDVDFIVHGDNTTNLLYVDAGSDKIGVATNSPEHILSVTGTLGVSGDTTVSGNMYLGGDLRLATAEKVEFRDANSYIHSPTSNDLEIVATDIVLDAATLIDLQSDAVNIGEGGDTDVVLTFNANSSDGVLTWMEDEDHFKFSDDVLLPAGEVAYFGNTTKNGGGYIGMLSSALTISGSGTGTNQGVYVSGSQMTVATAYGLAIQGTTTPSGDGAEGVIYFGSHGNSEYIHSPADNVLNVKAGATLSLEAPVLTLTGSSYIVAETNQLLLGGADDSDVQLVFVGNDSSGNLTWMEDEDHFKFSDDVVMNAAQKLYFHDEGGEYIHASSDGVLEIDAGTKVDITAATLDLNSSTKVDIDTPAMDIASTTSEKPVVTLANTANDATGPTFKLFGGRYSSGWLDAQDGDTLGSIEWEGYDDGTPSAQTYAAISASIDDATSGQESGRLTFQVASHDGGLDDAFVLVGGSADGEVDVTVGKGAASVTTVAGQLDVTSGIEVTTKEALTATSVSNTAAGSVSGTTRAGKITVTVGASHTIANGTSFSVPLSNSLIDEDSVIVCSNSNTAAGHMMVVSVMSQADNGCTFTFMNTTMAGINSTTFIITYLIL